MASEIEELRRQLQEQQRLREEAERRANTEQNLREAEQSRREEEQRLREEEQQRHERRTGKTSLPEFLDACHLQLYMGLTVQDKSQSTQGTAANAENKLRPRRILPWADFAVRQTAVWDALMASDFMSEKHFTSIHTLEESGEQLRQRQLSSELDLQYFARAAVEDPVTSIVKCLAHDAKLRDTLQLRGSITFENHGNMLSSDDVVEQLERLTINSEKPRRRSPRLRDRAHRSAPTHPSVLPAPAAGADRSLAAVGPKSSRPSADTFCVYSQNDEAGGVSHRRPAVVMELKPPHKLTLGHIYTGLQEMDVDDIVQERIEEDVTRRCQRLVAAVITQAYSYMIKAGLETGCVFTGQAFIFLRVPEDDPATVCYSLAVPHGDVGAETGWTMALDEDNRLHLTAIGQMLAFVLRAIQLPCRSKQWREAAQDQLETWVVVMEELEENIPEKEVQTSEYHPLVGDASSFLLQSPISRRLRRRLSQPHDIAAVTRLPTPDESEDDDDGEDQGGGAVVGEPTPSRKARRSQGGKVPPSNTNSHRTRQPKQTGQRRAPMPPAAQQDLGPYCTSSCLKGLVEGGPLDLDCPNVKQHGHGRHAIDWRKFRALVRRMLRHHRENCEELYVNGATGVLYRLRLPRWGYTVVAKGTTHVLIYRLLHEGEVYRRLRPIQGIYCPVYLGNFNLEREMWYAGVGDIKHLMLMSYEGPSLYHHCCGPALIEQALTGLQALHTHGVLHRDVAPRNVLYDAQRRQVKWHDFDRSHIWPRSPLQERWSNTECRPAKDKSEAQDRERAFVQELKAAASAMEWETRAVIM